MHSPGISPQIAVLSADQPPEYRLYALMDSSIFAAAKQSRMDDTLRTFAKEFAGEEMAALFSFAFDEPNLAASPILLPLGAPDSKLAEKVATFARAYRLSSWIWSPLPLEALAKHLASFIKAELDGHAVVLRPYDPRIMADVIECFSDERRAALTSPIGRWAYYDGRDKLGIVPCEEVALPFKPVPMPLELDTGEQERFEHLANRISLDSYIEEHAPSMVFALSADDRKVFCDRQITIGGMLGTFSMANLFIIAALTHAHGSQWVVADCVRDLIDDVKSANLELKDVAQKIDMRLKV